MWRGLGFVVGVCIGLARLGSVSVFGLRYSGTQCLGCVSLAGLGGENAQKGWLSPNAETHHPFPGYCHYYKIARFRS